MSRQSKFANEIAKKLRGAKGVTHVCDPSRGEWYRGKKMLKLANGTPGQVSVQVCEPEGQRTIYVYTTDCEATLAAAREIARKEGVNVRG